MAVNAEPIKEDYTINDLNNYNTVDITCNTETVDVNKFTNYAPGSVLKHITGSTLNVYMLAWVDNEKKWVKI